jgi:hypothetical protein
MRQIDKTELLGYIGMLLVLTAYVFNLFSLLMFVSVNIIGSTLLTIYSIKKKTIPLAVVNGFITLLLIAKFIQIIL